MTDTTQNEKNNSEKLTDFTILQNKAFEMGLTPIEGWVYARICMRGYKSVCFESMQNIAKACKASIRSVQNAFSKLKSLNMITISSGKNSGTSNHIILLPHENWAKVSNEVSTSCRPGKHLLLTPSAPPADPVSTSCLQTELGNRTQLTELIYVCEEKPNFKEPHTKKEKINVDKNDNYKSMSISLSKTLCALLRVKFIANEDCQDIIEKILDSGKCNKKDLRKIFRGLQYQNHFDIFSDRQPDLRTIGNDLMAWVEKKMSDQNQGQFKVQNAS
jgi:hypothetical protein